MDTVTKIDKKVYSANITHVIKELQGVTTAKN